MKARVLLVECADRPGLVHGIAGVLLAHGANVDLADRQGVTPLTHAEQRGQRAIADLLRRAGAEVTLATVDGNFLVVGRNGMILRAERTFEEVQALPGARRGPSGGRGR